MTSKRADIELLADLLRLVRKYGPEGFTDLAALLRDAEAMGTMASVLESVADTARQSRAATEKRRPARSKTRGDQISSLGDWSEIIERNRAEKQTAAADDAPDD